MAFPHTRPRRLRRTAALRSMVRKTRLHPSQFILPIFVQHGDNTRDEIAAIPGHARVTVDLAIELAQQASDAGVGGVLLFGIPAEKDALGSEAWSADGAVQKAVRAIRERGLELVVATDVCLCQYTDHGHCGELDDHGHVVNDATLKLLAKVAVSHAEAGADIVAPSDMMDGRVQAIRSALDAAGFDQTSIMSYSSKFASAYYGPFREAADSAPSKGDRATYQMDPANGGEAVRESMLDADEGADILMVKPALAFLDIVHQVADTKRAPVAVYHVSGEYAMIQAAAQRGWVDERAITLETLTSMSRAGADIIITYSAIEAAGWLSSDL